MPFNRLTPEFLSQAQIDLAELNLCVRVQKLANVLEVRCGSFAEFVWMYLLSSFISTQVERQAYRLETVTAQSGS